MYWDACTFDEFFMQCKIDISGNLGISFPFERKYCLTSAKKATISLAKKYYIVKKMAFLLESQNTSNTLSLPAKYRYYTVHSGIECIVGNNINNDC